MWGSNKSNDSNENRTSSIPQDLTVAPLADLELDLRSWVDNARDRFSELMDSTRWSAWNPGDQFRMSFSMNPFWADQMPSVGQYRRCLDKGGRSVWAEDGVWRCLFKGQSLPDNLSHEFKDYTGFLEYQRDLVQQREAKIEQDAIDRQLTGRQDQGETALTKAKESLSSLWQSDGKWGFPGSDRPRLITEDEAQGKQVVSQKTSSETVTLDDGSLQTRTKEVRYFSDGTAFVKNTSDTRDPPKGWFWK